MNEELSHEALLDKIKELSGKLNAYQSLAVNCQDLLYRTDKEGRITYLSNSVSELSGYTMEEAIGLNMAQDVYLVPEERDELVSILRRDGKVRNFAARLKRKDGSVWWASTNAHCLLDENGDIAGVEGIARDITDIMMAEERIKGQAERINIFFRSLDDAIFVHPIVEPGFANFVEVNRAACERYGYTYEEFLQLSTVDITLKSDSKLHSTQGHRSRLTEKGRLVFETVHIKKSGEKFPVEINSNIITEGGKAYILSVVRDITERKNLEAQSRIISQLEAMATLSGGIAHEFNNALHVVTGNIELIQMRQPDNEDLERFGRKTLEPIQRMQNLTKQLHAYARGGKYRATGIDLIDFVKSTLPEARSILPAEIYIDTEFSEVVPTIMADPDQLQMVVSAILLNSSEALEGVGCVHLRIREEMVDDAFIAGHPGVDPGCYVSMIIDDNGRGMDEETRSRIFDPFFSTKFQGRGLGMAAVYGIVKNHDGYVYVDSEPGRGTTVTILIPPAAIISPPVSPSQD